jgi:hypothetical protein
MKKECPFSVPYSIFATQYKYCWGKETVRRNEAFKESDEKAF